jgi:hypothetical protein
LAGCQPDRCDLQSAAGTVLGVSGGTECRCPCTAPKSCNEVTSKCEAPVAQGTDGGDLVQPDGGGGPPDGGDGGADAGPTCPLTAHPTATPTITGTETTNGQNTAFTLCFPGPFRALGSNLDGSCADVVLGGVHLTTFKDLATSNNARVQFSVPTASIGPQQLTITTELGQASAPVTVYTGYPSASLSPTVGTVSTALIATITGTNLDSIVTVEAVNNSAGTKFTATLSEKTATSIKVTFPVMPAGTYQVNIVSACGNPTSSITINP